MAMASSLHYPLSPAAADRCDISWMQSSLFPMRLRNSTSNELPVRIRFFRNPNHENNRPAADAGRSRSGSRRRGKDPSLGRLGDKSSRRKKPSDPYTRHPDDYYKYGPYGPYSYKAPVIGTLKPVTNFSDDHVLTWSNISDNNQAELVDIQNACISYDNLVRTFDESVGLQFFYVFVRLPFRYRNEPMWKEWSLVSEITVESGEALDKIHLSSKLSFEMKNRITKHTGWFRPDLVFVKKPWYQIRFEPQLEFIGELRKMFLEFAGEMHEDDSYYGKFCRILGLKVDASHEVITSKYEESPEEIQLACLEHLFTQHPVKLMYYVPYPHSSVWMKGGEGKDGTSEAGRNAGEENAREKDQSQFASSSMEGNGDESVNEESSDTDDDEINKWEDHRDDEMESDEQSDEGWVDDGDFQKSGDVIEGNIITEGEDDNAHNSTWNPSPFLKAAARPYNCVNFIREMVMLRTMMLERKKKASWDY